jgi:hypothetical protein
LSPSDRPTGQPVTAEDYQAVLRATDQAVEALRQLEESATPGDARDWAARRRRAGETEAAMLSAASATGRLAEYEAAVRAMVGERIPLDDAPPTLSGAAGVVAERLDRLADLFRRTQSADIPAPDTLSTVLRAAGRTHGSPTFEPVGTLAVPLQRAADSASVEAVRGEWVSETGSRRLLGQQGEDYVELWVEDADLAGPPLMPIALRGGPIDELLFALLAPVTQLDSRQGYLLLQHEQKHQVLVELGEPLRFDELRPSDAAAVLASIAASGRSWRELWRSAGQEIPWLATLAAQAPVEHERD